MSSTYCSRFAWSAALRSVSKRAHGSVGSASPDSRAADCSDGAAFRPNIGRLRSLDEAVGRRGREPVLRVGEVEVVVAGECQVPADELELELDVATAGAARATPELDRTACRVDST